MWSIRTTTPEDLGVNFTYKGEIIWTDKSIKISCKPIYFGQVSTGAEKKKITIKLSYSLHNDIKFAICNPSVMPYNASLLKMTAN